ncbi:DUF4136 domain-containing protein [Pontibacter deserti]|uniref:DUF4136 domain-containing protein n=1 Tax=Pontibacter deserti TaxID=1343896 RepID=UPI002025EB29|nr:DUF4136 domain-containing protein [Pontibacter deserti]
MLILCSAACSPVRVLDHEADTGFSLSKYKTFGFYEIEANGDTLKPYRTQLNYLEQELVQQLQQRGLQQSSSSPDLKINLGLVLAEKVQTRQTNFTNDAPLYFGERHYTWKSEEVVVRKYKQGTLSLHLVDNTTNKLVWHGAAEGVLPEDNTTKLQERIRTGVRELVQKIPL